MLNMTKVELKLIPDPDMYIFFEKVTRGGVIIFLINIVKQTISIWNLMTQNKNQNIIYLDTNNLYCYAMSKFLPTSAFKWIDPTEFDLYKYSSNSSKGCVLKVDLEYPRELQELHSHSSVLVWHLMKFSKFHCKLLWITEKLGQLEFGGLKGITIKMK